MTDLTHARELYSAALEARKVADAAEAALTDAVIALPANDLIGLDLSDPLAHTIVIEREQSLAVGTATSSVYHSLYWDDANMTDCKKFTRNMKVVARKGRRWCASCQNAI